MSDEAGTTAPGTEARRAGLRSARFRIAVQLAAWGVALAIVLGVEADRLREIPETGLPAWLATANVDTTLPLVLLLAAPLFWRLRRRLVLRLPPPAPSWHAWLLALVVAGASWGVSAWTAARPVGSPQAPRFGDLPPAYHDEYSYLFQAKTFLAGRASFPSHPDVPELFDQMHVLNDDGRFASRYFPGAGAWMAPFVALDRPYWGHWLAGALAAFFTFWAGRELAGDGVGFLAGLLLALAPGVGLFSNLLLAHHPALLGLSLFLFAFLRMMRTRRAADAAWAGVGLSFAMLCRPMTAAGFALPFGLWLAWTAGLSCLRSFQGPSSQPGTPATLGAQMRPVVAAMALPLLAGAGVLLAHNRATTGSLWVTPYQAFTDIYTPRHVYGFDNVRRGEQRLGPKVLDEYDRWAENLTPTLAVRNVRDRLVASWQSVVGIVPLAMASVIFVAAAPAEGRRWWLIAAGIVSLHAAHVPYWYVGIRNWHYVFESAPLWTLTFAGATRTLLAWWREGNRPWMPAWWGAVTLAALLPWYVPCEPLWPLSRVQAEVQEIAFSRRIYLTFQREIARLVQERPALVVVDEAFTDRHIDFVVNDPGLDGEVLYGRLRPEHADLAEIVAHFPDRTVYLLLADGEAFSTALDRQAESVAIAPVGGLAVSRDRTGRAFRVVRPSPR